MENIQLRPIGIIHSCFKEKFGIPRQSGLVTAATATLELLSPYDCPEALEELQGFSHVWLVFVFHQAMREDWKPTVRPPRLGGNRRIGVFASRSPFRPNPIGLSAVKLEGIQCSNGRCTLEISGADLLDGTPVLDIKPYLPYADALPDAQGGFAARAPVNEMLVLFAESAAEQCARWQQDEFPGLRQLIEQTLQADPRPAYSGNEAGGREYGVRLYDLDVRWRVRGRQIEVFEVVPWVARN
jgi:tRNA (adenine37-N6)-methyltransferase